MSTKQQIYIKTLKRAVYHSLWPLPTIDFQKNINYFNNNLKEKGKKLKILFEYNSGTNSFFLKQGGIKKLLRGINKSDTL